MKSVKLVLILVLAVALAAVVLQNQVSWQVRFLWLTGEVPGISCCFLRQRQDSLWESPSRF